MNMGSRLREMSSIFWPVSTRNYYLWPFFFLIPLMIGDVITTTIAVSLGYPELNPLLVNIVQTPLRHLALKTAVPVLLLILSIALYSSEAEWYAGGNEMAGFLFRILKFSIFVIIVIDCIVYTGTFLSNTRLIVHHHETLRDMHLLSG